MLTRWLDSSTVRTTVAAAVLYAGLGFLSLFIAQSTGLAAPVWPAAGLAFALVYQRGWPVAIGVSLGSFIVNSWTLERGAWSLSTIVVTAGLIGVGAGLQAVVGAHLVRRFVGARVALNRGGQVLAFLLLAGPVATLVNPSIGVAAQLSTGIIAPSEVFIGWLTWWVGDAIGVIVFAPLVLMFLPEQTELWTGRRWKVAIPSLAVTFVLLAAFVQNRALDQDRVALLRNQLAETAVADLQDAVAQHAEVLYGIEGLVVASDAVTAAEFQRFTARALERFPNLQAVSWNPYLRRDQLATFEAEQRVQSGLAGFRATERAADGEMQPVSERDDYVIVSYIEPMAQNGRALGFDIGSNPVRRVAIERAIDTGEIASTAPVELVQETGSQQGMLTLVPVFAGGIDPGAAQERREAIEGFAVGVYRLGDMLADTFDSPDWDGVDVELVDVTEDPIEIGHRLPDGALAVGEHENPTSPATTRTFTVNGRTWEVQVRPDAALLDEVTQSNEPALLLGSMFIIGLLEAFLLLVTGMERTARRRAETADHQASHDALTGLLNRRGFGRAFDASLERVEREGSPLVLLFVDLDDFKPVNDLGGHDAGDELLRLIADAMRGSVRSRDVVGRLGGDEFAIVLNDCGLDRGLAIAEQLDRAIRDVSVQVRGTDLTVGASIGVVDITSASRTADELLRSADLACYEAKLAGGGVRRAMTTGQDSGLST